MTTDSPRPLVVMALPQEGGPLFESAHVLNAKVNVLVDAEIGPTMDRCIPAPPRPTC